MSLGTLFTKASQAVKSNSPEILTALSISGLLTTSYLAGRAGYQAAHKLESEPADMTLVERAKKTWKVYVPAGISGVLTTACIVGASRATNRRTAAAVTAYSLTERAFSEYREKVVEQIGKGKEQKLRDEVAQDRITRNPPSQVIITSGGDVLCCELFTHRYFKSDMETLKQAQNKINYKILQLLYVTLEDFYDLIDLPHTSNSSNLGWDSDKLMELQFSTILSEGGEPCLAFDYNYTKPLR